MTRIVLHTVDALIKFFKTSPLSVLGLPHMYIIDIQLYNKLMVEYIDALNQIEFFLIKNTS